MNLKPIKHITFCLPIIFIFGCGTTQKQTISDKTPLQSLEKRIDDLSKSVTLIIRDTNVLHNKLDILAESQDSLARKIGKLEEGVTYLSKNLSDTSSSDNHDSEHNHIFDEIKGEGRGCEGHAGHEHPASDTHIHDETIRAVTRNIATGFWDALMANDLEAAKSFATSATGSNLKLNDSANSGSSQATFGNIIINENKTIIETTLNTQKDGSQISIPMQTILVKENNQWKVDADQTMMSIFGGAMGELMEGLGEAMKSSMEGMGKALAEGLTESMDQGGAADIATSEARQNFKREEYIRKHIVPIAEQQFPDNKGLTWSILGFEHKEHLTYVEVEPKPSTVGYPRFKFVASFINNESPQIIATYCLEGNKYVLLCTVPGLTENLPKEIQ